jgi:hypothetical protein
MGTAPVDSLKEGWKSVHKFGSLFGSELLHHLLRIAFLVCDASILSEGLVVFVVESGLFMLKKTFTIPLSL